MKPTEFIVENSVIAQEADDMHRDHEVQMARSQMYSAAQAAIEIHRLLRDVSELEGLEGWVQSKLTLASQYLESVRDYMKYEAVSQEPEMMVFAEDAANYAVESIIKRSIKEQTTAPGTSTPVIGGMSRTVGTGGDITTRSDIGGTSVSQTKTPGGFTKQTTATMDMGGAGSASMVKSAPQQPGQMTGTTTVTRTAAAPKYDADAGIFGNAPAAQPASGSAVQGVAFGGASGKNVGNNVVTTGDTDLAQQAKAVMPAQNANLEEDDDDVIVRKPGGDYADPRDGYSRSKSRDRILNTPPGEINPGLQKYAERNTPRKMGDSGLSGAKDNYSSNRPEGVRVRDFTIGGQIVGGPPTKIERPGGVPRVERIPATRFGAPGPGGDTDPRLGADLDPKSMMKRSMKEEETGVERDASARRENERFDSARNYQGRNARGDVIRSGGEVVKGNPNPPSMIQRAAGALGLPNKATDALGDPMYKSSRPKSGGGGGGGRGSMSGHLADPSAVKSLIPNFESKNNVKESATGGASSSSGVATSMGGPSHKPTSGVPKKMGNSYKTKRVAVGKGVYDK
jgi:hypothetical protein